MGLIDKARNSISKKRGSAFKNEGDGQQSGWFKRLSARSSLRGSGSTALGEAAEKTDTSTDHSSGLFSVARNGLNRRTSKKDEEEVQQQEVYLLDRLGGMDVLGSIINDFLGRVTHDKRLMVFFEDVDFQLLAAHQKIFFAMAFTKVPEGESLETIVKVKHQRLFEKGLNETHYDIVVGEHLMGVLTKRGFNGAILEEIASTVAPLRKIFVAASHKAAAGTGRVPAETAGQSQMIHAS